MTTNDLRRIAVGMSIQTQRGLGVVSGIDVRRDMVLTTVGTYPVDEVEMVQRPDSTDPDAIENWLNGPDIVAIPRYRSNSATIECSCNCGACYCLQTFINGKPRTRVHQSNSACRCETRGCFCVRA